MDIFQIRWDLHQIPELAFNEFKTQKYLIQLLSGFEGLNFHHFEPTGFLVEYSPASGKYLLFRTDMDALAITECTGAEYSSIHTGRMHACGHDVHMTILAGLIEKVIKEKPQRNILFLFQPAEEGQGGAEKVLADPIWDNYDIEAAYALHVSPELPAGVISSKTGNFFAATAEFDLEIQGVSAHIAMPEKGKNALQAAIEIYLAVQQLKHIVKSQEKFICDFGILNAGTVRNAIPAHASLSGTIRAKDITSVAVLKDTLQSISHAIASACDVETKIKYLAEYQEVYNSAPLVDNLKLAAAKNNVEFRQAETTMAGEDFGFIAARWGGLLFWLGARGNYPHPLHSDKFLPDENSINIGINLFFDIICQ
jgi:N-acetyldiaminopimelate deacetylase